MARFARASRVQLYLKESQLPQSKDASETFVTVNERRKRMLPICCADLNCIRYLKQLECVSVSACQRVRVRVHVHVQKRVCQHASSDNDK